MTEQEVLDFILKQQIRVGHITTLLEGLPPTVKSGELYLATVNAQKCTLYLERLITALGLTYTEKPTVAPHPSYKGVAAAFKGSQYVTALPTLMAEAEAESLLFATEIIPVIPNMYNNNKFVVDSLVAESYRGIIEVAMYIKLAEEKLGGNGGNGGVTTN